MARLPLGFLWLMALIWATYQQPAKTVLEGERLDVKCSMQTDEGVYWFRQKEDQKPVFLLYISSIGKIKTENRNLKATASSRTSTLNILKFTKEDTGKYFCLVLENSKLIFGNVQAYSLPEVITSTPKVTTKKQPSETTKTPQISTTSPSRGKEPKDDTWSCDFFIWVPLTGGASLLLVILVGVSIMYCKQPRRRRCQHQFRKRPMPEENRRPPNYY